MMSHCTDRVCVVLGTALLFLLSVSSAAAARPAAITGKLSVRGLTVIAVSTNGKAKTVVASNGTFRIRPPAGRVSLHLRRSDGLYAGPIVIASENRGRRAIIGVRAGTRLGRISVSRRGGYARVKRRPAERRIDASLWARAKRGVPVGAQVFGRVRSKPPRATVTGDRDVDGVPDPLDIDDDGDLILDNFEHPNPAVARAAQVTGFDTALHLMNVLPIGINETTNANAGTTLAESDAMLAKMGYLIISEVAGDSAELDCGLLDYCRAGGTGHVFGPNPEPKFPECCDPDGDGMGTIARNPILPQPTAGMFLHHGATTAQLKTGDVLIERVTTGGVQTAYPATLQYVFATIPALAYYDDTAVDQHSATVTYPVPFGTPGTPGYGFPVSAGPNGEIVLHLRFWRPQRWRIEGEAGTGDWTDIGGLTYIVGPQVPSAPAVYCPQDSFSDPSSELSIPTSTDIPGTDASGQPGGGFSDTAPDRPADRNNMITFTLNVSRCFASRGIVWTPGTEISIGFRGIAGNGRDSAEQTVGFKLVS